MILLCGNIAFIFSYHGNYSDGQDPKSYYHSFFFLIMRYKLCTVEIHLHFLSLKSD